jgi:uncharacterized C2H2 Zn-finger protein
VGRTFVRMGLGPELLPCPTCHAVSRAPIVLQGIEVVRCERCGKLLRRRPALTAEQRAQALALRWAAHQLEDDPNVRMIARRRKSRGEPEELYVRGKLAAVDKLREWARTIHKRPPIGEVSIDQ